MTEVFNREIETVFQDMPYALPARPAFGWLTSALPQAYASLSRTPPTHTFGVSQRWLRRLNAGGSTKYTSKLVCSVLPEISGPVF